MTSPPDNIATTGTDVLVESWPQVRAALLAGRGKVAELWLKPDMVRPVSLVDGELVLGCANVLLSSTIPGRIGKDLMAVVAEVLGQPVDRLRCHVSGPDLARHEARRGSATAAPAGPIPRVARPRTWGQGFKALDRFVVGSANRLAYDAIQGLIDDPLSGVSPIFIHGKSGLGKTHLIQGLALAYADRHHTAKVQYLRCEQFTNEWFEAIKNGAEAIRTFRVRLRHPDLLLIDDLHFLAKVTKQNAIKELFETFVALADQGKKVVFTSDAAPRDITYLEDSFKQRFVGGLVVELRRPDPELRKAIVQAKAEAQGLRMPETVAAWIADRFLENVREIEGAVNKLAATAKTFGRPVDLPLAQDALRDLLEHSAGTDVIEHILREVADRYGLEPAQLTGKGRSGPACSARHVAMYLIRMATGGTYAAVGKPFGKGHPAVVYACEQVRPMLAQDQALEAFVRDLLARLRPA